MEASRPRCDSSHHPPAAAPPAIIGEMAVDTFFPGPFHVLCLFFFLLLFMMRTSNHLIKLCPRPLVCL